MRYGDQTDGHRTDKLTLMLAVLSLSVSSRIQNIQAVMTERCIELLNLPSYPDEPETAMPCMLLDIGCGSGLSGEILSDEGHHWVGLDISPSMLEVALERDVEGDLFLHDIGQGFGFRPGSFDGAIRWVGVHGYYKQLKNFMLAYRIPAASLSYSGYVMQIVQSIRLCNALPDSSTLSLPHYVLAHERFSNSTLNPTNKLLSSCLQQQKRALLADWSSIILIRKRRRNSISV